MSPFRTRITLPRPLWYSTGLILLFNGLLFAWLLININNQALLASVDYWAQTLGPLLMLPFGFLALWNAWRKKSGAHAVTGIIYPSSSLDGDHCERSLLSDDDHAPLSGPALCRLGALRVAAL